MTLDDDSFAWRPMRVVKASRAALTDNASGKA